MPGKRHAIVIGCNEYRHLDPLRCAVNDAAAIKEVLANKDIGGFDNVQLFNQGENSLAVTSCLEETFTAAAETEDLIVVYFSGHGKLDAQGKLYLALAETKETTLDSTSVSMARLISYAGRSRCRAILLMLDCCYSGAVRGAIAKGKVDDAITATSLGSGLRIITSSTHDEESHEREGEENSLFTRFMLEGFRTGSADMNNDGWITDDEIYKYTFNSVKGTGLQNPTQFNLSAQGELRIARNPAHTPVQEPSPDSASKQEIAKFYAIKSMIEMLANKPPPIFMVMLPNYYIEGIAVPTSGFTVSPDHTPNIRQTTDGFECDAFYPPHMLSAPMKARKEAVNGVVKVRMRIASSDILLIHGVMNEGKGPQLTLYGA